VGWRRDEKGSNDPCSAELAKKKNPNYFFFQQVHATHRPTDHAMSILLETKNAHSQGGENIFRACCAVPKQTEIRNLNSDSTLAQTREQVRRIRLPDPAITRADLRGLDLMPSLRMEGRRSTVIDGGVGYATQQPVTAALSCVFPSDPDRNILPPRHICPFQACDKPMLTSRGDNLILGMSVLRCKTRILYRNGMSRMYDGPSWIRDYSSCDMQKTMFESSN
jgi:hypothetical protein